MTRTEMLELYGRGPLAIEPARSEHDGMWRIRFAADFIRPRFLDARAATMLADELRHGGERLLATRIEICIEQARRLAASESVDRCLRRSISAPYAAVAAQPRSTRVF
jgi:hypothetical protein